MATYADIFERVVAGAYENAPAEEKLAAVREVIQVASIASAAVSIQPLPLIDMAFIAPIQIGMVQSIGRVHGHRLDRKTVIEVLSSFGAGLVTQGVLLSTSKLVPIVGWIAAVPMAYALTWSVGEVAHYYFQSGRGVPQAELKSLFRKIYESKRAEKSAASKQMRSLKDRLRDLIEAREAGLISEQEFQQKKEDLLSAL